MFLAVRCNITGRFRVCHNKRITRNKVFRDYAERGKSTMGWYFGFKLHLICNERGELLNFMLTKANVDDRNTDVFNRLSDNPSTLTIA